MQPPPAAMRRRTRPALSIEQDVCGWFRLTSLGLARRPFGLPLNFVALGVTVRRPLTAQAAQAARRHGKGCPMPYAAFAAVCSVLSTPKGQTLTQRSSVVRRGGPGVLLKKQGKISNHLAPPQRLFGV